MPFPANIPSFVHETGETSYLKDHIDQIPSREQEIAEKSQRKSIRRSISDPRLDNTFLTSAKDEIDEHQSHSAIPIEQPYSSSDLKQENSSQEQDVVSALVDCSNKITGASGPETFKKKSNSRYHRSSSEMVVSPFKMIESTKQSKDKPWSENRERIPSVGVEDKVFISGWMKKRSKVLHKWRRRFFVLTSQIIYVFTEEKHAKIRESMLLMDSRVYQEVEIKVCIIKCI